MTQTEGTEGNNSLHRLGDDEGLVFDVGCPFHFETCAEVMTFGFLFAIIAYAFAVGGHLLFAGELGATIISVLYCNLLRTLSDATCTDLAYFCVKSGSSI